MESKHSMKLPWQSLLLAVASFRQITSQMKTWQSLDSAPRFTPLNWRFQDFYPSYISPSIPEARLNKLVPSFIINMHPQKSFY